MLTYPDLDNIAVFVSHSSSEKKIASKLKRGLEDYGFDVFVAHDDMFAGEDWMAALITEIKERDVFLILLSKQYHVSDYTDHEVGIAHYLRKHIIPLSIDGTKPYGFMSKYQSEKAKKVMDIETIETVVMAIYVRLRNDFDIVDAMIAAY